MLSSLAPCIIVPLLLLLWNSRGRLQGSPWPAVAVILYYGYALAHGAADNIRTPREWDYACFWLYGHIAAAHGNIYDPAVFARFATPFVPSYEFRAAVLNVGFPYPPPSIALFLPLGYIPSIPLGLAIWYAVQFAALAGAAWILARTFMPSGTWRSALLVLAIVTALPAAGLTVDTAQTNFLLLLIFGLALAGRGTTAGALWETLAVWVKPYAVLLVVLDLLHARWRRLTVVATTAVLSLIAATLFLGPAAVTTYLRANPAGREPAFAFVETVNVSLLAVVARLHAVLPPHITPLNEPLYLAAAAFFTVTTVALCRRAPSDVGFAAMVLLGLLIYPGVLSSYEVVLVIPLLVIWKYREVFIGGTAGAAAVVAMTVALQSGSHPHEFVANVLVWLSCAALLYRQRSAVADAVTGPASSAGLHTVGAA